MHITHPDKDLFLTVEVFAPGIVGPFPNLGAIEAHLDLWNERGDGDTKITGIYSADHHLLGAAGVRNAPGFMITPGQDDTTWDEFEEDLNDHGPELVTIPVCYLSHSEVQVFDLRSPQHPEWTRSVVLLAQAISQRSDFACFLREEGVSIISEADELGEVLVMWLDREGNPHREFIRSYKADVAPEDRMMVDTESLRLSLCKQVCTYQDIEKGDRFTTWLRGSDGFAGQDVELLQDDTDTNWENSSLGYGVTRPRPRVVGKEVDTFMTLRDTQPVTLLD